MMVLNAIRNWWRHSLLVGPVIFGVAMFMSFVLAIVVTVVLITGGDSWAKRGALCDDVVHQLLHSKDLVEVTRAGIIIDRLDCRVSRRL